MGYALVTWSARCERLAQIYFPRRRDNWAVSRTIWGVLLELDVYWPSWSRVMTWGTMSTNDNLIGNSGGMRIVVYLAAKRSSQQNTNLTDMQANYFKDTIQYHTFFCFYYFYFWETNEILLEIYNEQNGPWVKHMTKPAKSQKASWIYMEVYAYNSKSHIYTFILHAYLYRLSILAHLAEHNKYHICNSRSPIMFTRYMLRMKNL